MVYSSHRVTCASFLVFPYVKDVYTANFLRFGSGAMRCMGDQYRTRIAIEMKTYLLQHQVSILMVSQ